MILQPGEKLFIVNLRNFDSDIRRHFFGEVDYSTEHVARVTGYAFVMNNRNEFERKEEKRTRIFSLTDGRLVINIIPSSTIIEEIHYFLKDGRLHISDGHDFDYDIDEFRKH
jgi:hypothetical protein